jgi:hypothetical protein
MKRLVQFVAVLVIAFLAAQPAQALITCAFDSSPITSACPMEMSGMNSMGADCSMSRNMETSACAPDCCTHPAAVATAIAVPVRPRLSRPPQYLEQQLANPTAQPVTGDSPLAAPTFSPPPRYVLPQTFRI